MMLSSIEMGEITFAKSESPWSPSKLILALTLQRKWQTGAASYDSLSCTANGAQRDTTSPVVADMKSDYTARILTLITSYDLTRSHSSRPRRDEGKMGLRDQWVS